MPWRKNDALRRADVLRPFSSPPGGLRARALQAAGLLALVLFCFAYGFAYALTTPYLITPLAAPLVGLMLLVVWALPDSNKRPPTRTMVVLLFGFSVVLLVWPRYLAFDAPGLPWITFQRLVAFPLALATLVAVSTSPKLRKELGDSLADSKLVLVAMVLFAALQILTLPLSGSMADSIQKAVEAQIFWTLMFFVSVYAFRRPGRVAAWAAMFCGCMVLVALVGIVEWHEKRVLWAGHIPSFLAIGDPVVQGVLDGNVRSGSGFYRARSVAIHPLVLAEILSLCSPFAFYFLIRGPSVLIRLAAGVCAATLVTAIYFTDSRMGLIGFGVAALLTVLVEGVLRWRRHRSDVLGPSLVLAFPAAAIAVVTATFVFRRIRREVWGGGAQASSDDARVQQVEVGLRKVMENPFGYGIGEGGRTLNLASIDNYFLNVILEFGVVGFAVYLVLIVGALWLGARALLRQPAAPKDREVDMLAPVTIAIVLFALSKAVLSQVDNHAIFFIFLGMIVALRHRAAEELRAQAEVSASPAPAETGPGRPKALPTRPGLAA